ncbi:MAG: riboflavin synthase [Janthinobacterium lividum]
MFTGLVEATGTLRSIQPTAGATRLVIDAPTFAGRWKQGDSIAVNGVCLTAIPLGTAGSGLQAFAADLAEETVHRTTLASLRPGSLVNLELPTPAGAPLGGHVVQGHVDGTGTLVSLLAVSPDLETTDWRMTLQLPPELNGFVIAQGSITIDGISLTVAKVHPVDAAGHVRIEIAVIPHTWRSTHLHTLAAGALVNIEADVLSKYAEQRAAASGGTAESKTEWLTGSYLLANGY